MPEWKRSHNSSLALLLGNDDSKLLLKESNEHALNECLNECSRNKIILERLQNDLFMEMA